MSKPKYFLYARKSTEDDDKQVMSIEAQLFELREFASKENLEILAEFQESKSAKTPGRSVFGEMMSKIEQLDGVGILAWHPDRLARNSIDGGRIIYAVDQRHIVSLRFPTFWFEPTPQGLFMLQVAFGQSKYYSDNLAQNVIRGMRQKIRRGEWLTKAPFGYVNNRQIRNIEPHPTHSKIIVRAFIEYSKGTYSYDALAEFLSLHGVTQGSGAPLVKASIRRILTNRAYLGFTKHHDEWFAGSFPSILSPKLFAAVQKVLKKRERPHTRKAHHDFPFTGLFRCGECDSMFTAQWATGKCGGRYRYYRCTKKKGVCSQGYLREDVLVSQVQARLQTISLCDAWTEYMLQKVEKMQHEESDASHSVAENLSEEIKASDVRLEKLVSAFLDGDIPKDIYLKKKDEIMRTTLALKQKKKDSKQQGKNWVEPLKEWILDTKQANFLSSSTDFHEISSFVKKVGTNPTIRYKSVRFVAPVPSEFIAKQNVISPLSLRAPRADVCMTSAEVSMCDSTGNRTPITRMRILCPSR